MPVPAGLIAERRLLMRLLRANAVSAAAAQPLEGLNWIESRRLTRLVDADVVRDTGSRQFYLNAPALAEHLSARRQRAAMVLAVVVVIVGLSVYFMGSMVQS